MKLLLDIKDDKAEFVLELLKNFKFVSITHATYPDNLLLKELKEAVDELNLIKKGKRKGMPLDQLLGEL